MTSVQNLEADEHALYRRIQDQGTERFVAHWLRCIRSGEELDSKWPLIERQLRRRDVARTHELIVALESFMLERGHWQAFELCFGLLVELWRDAEHALRRSAAFTALARLYFRVGRISDATNVLDGAEQACAQLARDATQAEALGVVYLMRGAISRQEGDKDRERGDEHLLRAIQHGEHAVTLLQRTENRHQIARALFNLAAGQSELALRKPNDPMLVANAKETFRASRERFIALNQSGYVARIQIRLARMLVETGDAQGGLQELERHQAWPDENKDPRLWTDLNLIRAKAFERLDKKSRAIDIAERALAIAQAHGMETESRELRALLARCQSARE